MQNLKNSKISLFVNHHFDKLNHIEFKLNFGKLVNQDYGKVTKVVEKIEKPQLPS